MPRLIRRSKGRKRGAGFSNFLSKANSFLKSTKLISTLGNMGMSFVPPQYQGIASGLLSGATKLGYGRRKGGALRSAGGSRRMVRRR